MRLSHRRRTTTGMIALVLTLFMAACGGSTSTTVSGSPISTEVRPASLLLTPPATPGPIIFPRDDGPHADLTEWWYYTGHLATHDGRHFGFEFVIFQGKRAGFPATYAAHFAITDIASGSFHYDQRTQSGGPPNPTTVIDLAVGDWSIRGDGSQDHISATMPGYTLSLDVVSQKPPVLHGGDGYFDWAPATASYYYSRTDMAATGTLAVNGATLNVNGQAWMDHQWGNFLLIGGGGWDWYSIQLNDGQEFMLWHSRDAKNQITFGSGTLVDNDGTAYPLAQTDFTITPAGSWTSPTSVITYPSGWQIDIPKLNLKLTLNAVLKDQELDTSSSTGVIYWEGDVQVKGSQNGNSVTGQGYVELTGYTQNVDLRPQLPTESANPSMD